MRRISWKPIEGSEEDILPPPGNIPVGSMYVDDKGSLFYFQSARIKR